MKKIKGILINTTNNSVVMTDCYKSPNGYSEKIGSASIEILPIKVQGIDYAVVYDSEGYNRPFVQRSILDKEYNVITVGNVLIFKLTDTDELDSLSKEEMNIIFDNIKSSQVGEELQPFLLLD